MNYPQQRKPWNVENGVYQPGKEILSDHAVELNGEWLFYPDRLLLPGAETGTAAGTIKSIYVPMAWNGKISGNGSPGHGCGTYRLRMEGLEPARKYGFVIPDIPTSCRVYINGILEGACGNPSIHPDANLPLIHSFPVSFTPDPGGRADVIIQVANYALSYGGMWKPPVFGSDIAIRSYWDANFFMDSFMSGGILIICLFHFIQFILRKSDFISLAFAVFSFLVFIKSIFSGLMLFYIFFPDSNYLFWNRLVYLAITFIPPAFLFYMQGIFPEEVPQPAIIVSTVLATIEGLVILLTPTVIYEGSYFVYQLLMILTGLFIMIILLRALRRKRSGVYLFLSAFAVLYAVTINDVLFDRKIIHTFFMLDWGLVAFIFLQSALIARQVSVAGDAAKKLASELEIRVIDRTVELNRRLEERGQILSILSHDLRSPLAAAIQLLEIAIYRKDNRNTDSYQANLLNASERAKDAMFLMDQLLGWTRIRIQSEQLQVKAFPLKQIVFTALLPITAAAREKNIRLESDISQNIQVKTEFMTAETILRNLVQNAIKFTPEKGEIRISAEIRREHCRISVIDSGIGLSEEILNSLFQPGTDVHKAGTSGEKGVGIGLMICRELAQELECDIFAKNHPNGGAEFSFTLPIAE